MRADRLYAVLKENGIPAAVYHSRINIRYLTGYTGEGCALIAGGQTYIITDFRYYEQCERQAPECVLVKTGKGVGENDCIKTILSDAGITSLAVETNEITVNTYRQLQKKLEGVTLTELPDFCEKMRTVKDQGEFDDITKACEIACRAFVSLLDWIKPGMTEKEVQVELDYRMLKFGGEMNSFDTIACAGPNGSLPHAIPGDRPIREGELLTLDFGTKYNGYCSDTTRTIGIGKIGPELRKLYQAVLDSQLIALDMIKPGASCKAIDLAARDYLEARYPGAFGHSLGHGVGLFIHEQPGLSYRSEAILEPGHVVTIEPGVYIPGLGGCRIEDMALITEDGFINPVTAPKQLVEVY